MDKTKVIDLASKVIIEASENGKDYSWMYQPFNSLEDLCEELNISDEEIQDKVTAKGRFNIEDIDGCEFVKVRGLGNALISYDHDFGGFMTGKIQVVYSDGSGSTISMEEAQGRIDSGEWTVIKE